MTFPHQIVGLAVLTSSPQSTTLANQFKPAILQCFGDIASAIGGHFETYLTIVAQVLQQAATITAGPDGSYEMIDYVISLREGIMDAWGGIIGAMKTSNKSMLYLHPQVFSWAFANMAIQPMSCSLMSSPSLRC